MKNDNDYQTKETVKKILDELLADPSNGIERILTGEEAGIKGADSTCAFMVEALRGFYFLESHEGDYIKPVTQKNVWENNKYMLACHGYSPDKQDYSTFFLAAGKGILENVEVPFMRLIDIGPTLARLLGVDLGQTDGQEIKQFLNLRDVYPAPAPSPSGSQANPPRKVKNTFP